MYVALGKIILVIKHILPILIISQELISKKELFYFIFYFAGIFIFFFRGSFELKIIFPIFPENRFFFS